MDEVARIWKDKESKLVYIPCPTPYVRGIVCKRIRLTFWQRLRILFSKGMLVSLIQDKEA